MKRTSLWCLLLLCCLAFSGCTRPPAPPDIQVTCGSAILPYQMGLNQWDGAVYDREDNFHALVQAGTPFSYCKLGETVRISFPEGAVPDRVVLTDSLLKEDGSLKYEKTDQEIPLEFSGGAAEFTLTAHFAVSLSSSTEDTAPGAVARRGFRLTCSWGDNACEYAFVLCAPATSQPPAA